MSTPSRKPRRPEASGATQPLDTVVVGRITGAYGVRGDVRLKSFTDPASNMLDYQPWLIADAGGWRELECEHVRPHGEGFVAHLAGVDDRNHAETLKGAEIAVPADALPAAGDGEYYWRDLIGLEVIGADGGSLGRVDWLLETGRYDTLVVRPPAGRDVLIPFAPAYVTEVDLEGGRLIVDWRVEDLA